MRRSNEISDIPLTTAVSHSQYSSKSNEITKARCAARYPLFHLSLVACSHYASDTLSFMARQEAVALRVSTIQIRNAHYQLVVDGAVVRHNNDSVCRLHCFHREVHRMTFHGPGDANAIVAQRIVDSRREPASNAAA